MVLAENRLDVVLRIVNGKGQVQRVVILARVALLDGHIDAMWMASAIDPAAVIRSIRLHNEGIIVFPVSDRVSVPPGIWSALCTNILREVSPIRPDLTPYPVVLQQLNHTI